MLCYNGIARYEGGLGMKHQWIRHSHIQTRLLVGFIVFSLLPLLLTGSLLYMRSSQAIHQKIEYYSSEILNQISQNIDRELARLEYDSIEIMFSKDVQDSLLAFDKLSEWEKLQLSERLNEWLVKKFSFLHDVSDVLIYTEDNEKILAYGDEGSNVLNYQSDYLEEMHYQAREAKGAPVWFATNIEQEIHRVSLLVHANTQREGIVLTRIFRHLENGNVLGMLLMRTNEAYFSNIYASMDLSKQKILVLNSRNKVISTNSKNWLVGESFPTDELILEIQKLEKVGNNDFQLTLDQPYVVVFDKVKNADWYIISFTPKTYIAQETDRILRFTIIIGVISFMIAIFASTYVSQSISIPLKGMIKRMKRVQGGELDVVSEDQAKDELALVNEQFNLMIDKVKALLIETKLREKEKRVAELSALQAQINPHFLSNTLNSVKWMANNQKADNIENLVGSLISLLQVAMGKEEDFITISQEITYLEHYLNIQSYRYYDKFKVNIDVDEEVKAALIPRFLIQPIVENALIHGLVKNHEPGFIAIKVWLEEKDVYVSVTDNGGGLSQEAIREIMNTTKPAQNHFSGIGLPNVRERIKLYFGDSYDLEIESLVGSFTRMTFFYPYMKGSDVDDKHTHY